MTLLLPAPAPVLALPSPRYVDNVYCADALAFLRGMPDASVDAVITDPPYPKQYLPLYGVLAEQSARILKPGGSLVAMCGGSWLPQIMELMTPHLRYQWTLAYMTMGATAPQWDRRLNTFWKPLLWFVKDKYTGPWVGDVIHSGMNDKRFHYWGQSESGMIEQVRRFTKPGDLVVDPFAGGGTTLVVAKQLGRHFTGCDIDSKHVATCLRRLAEPRNMPLPLFADAPAPSVAAAVQESFTW